MAEIVNWSDNDLDKIWAYRQGNRARGRCPKVDCPYITPMIKTNYGNESKTDWVVDHIIPVAKGGTNTLGNLQPMHNYCNSQKSDNIE